MDVLTVHIPGGGGHTFSPGCHKSCDPLFSGRDGERRAEDTHIVEEPAASGEQEGAALGTVSCRQGRGGK